MQRLPLITSESTVMRLNRVVAMADAPAPARAEASPK